MLGRSRSSAHLHIDRCCPWVTVSDRCYGHAEGTAGEDEPRSSVAARVTSSNQRVRLGVPARQPCRANVTDLRGFVPVRKRCCAGTP
jgi:hypothetical protein